MKHIFSILLAVTALFLMVPTVASAADDVDPDTEMLKPKIEYVRVDSITHDPSGYFNILHYTVKWRGDSWLGVGVGEYYDGMLTLPITIVNRNYSEYAFVEDGVTYYEISRNTGIISPDCYAYITFYVGNQWGKDEYEIELLPGGILSTKEIIGDVSGGDGLFEVFDIGGRRIGVFSSREEIKDAAPKGLLMVRRIRNDRVISTEKLLNR
ncbi:MAG: hypothetical protein K2K37_05980 [Muribaculaceae bacterium]|nr:hypothetical protein [Muribaculaceae bacterium]